MMLCDFYAITSPVNDIVLKMIELPITMTNLLEAFATARSLERVEAYKDVAKDLQERCTTFARCNLGCWNNTLDFVIRNKDNFGFSLQLLGHLREEKEISIRMKIIEFSKVETLEGFNEVTIVKAPTYLFRQSMWNVHLKQKGNITAVCFLFLKQRSDYYIFHEGLKKEQHIYLFNHSRMVIPFNRSNINLSHN